MILSIAFIAIIGIQIIFISLLFFSFLKKQKSTASAAQPPVSVIVCAHDEEENIRELVPVLLAQNYSAFEVIIVEDRCNDGTYDYLLQATKENERLKVVNVSRKPEHINGKKYALTLGIKAAQYDWVLLTDADCRPINENWIASMANQMQEPTKIVIGFSPYFKTKGLLNSFIRFESFLTGLQYVGFALLGKPYMGVGRNLAYRKNLFLDNKGFNSHLGITGGDDDLFVNEHATQQNTVVNIGSDALMFSKPETMWNNFWHQKFRHLSVGKHYKFSDKFLLGIFSLTWMGTWFLLPFTFCSELRNVILILFALRMILLIVSFHIVPKKLGASFETWKTPFLDFMYAFYYLVIGAKALFVKNVKWKN